MDSHLMIGAASAATAAAAAFAAVKLKHRLELSRAKHRSLAGHSKMSRRLARLIPFYDYGEAQFFCSDGAPPEVATQRREGFFRLAGLYAQRFAQTRRLTAQAAEWISDLQFTQAYRVPFQYSALVRQNLGAGSFVQSSQGVTVTDLDGNIFYD